MMIDIYMSSSRYTLMTQKSLRSDNPLMWAILHEMKVMTGNFGHKSKILSPQRKISDFHILTYYMYVLFEKMSMKRPGKWTSIISLD